MTQHVLALSYWATWKMLFSYNSHIAVESLRWPFPRVGSWLGTKWLWLKVSNTRPRSQRSRECAEQPLLIVYPTVRSHQITACPHEKWLEEIIWFQWEPERLRDLPEVTQLLVSGSSFDSRRILFPYYNNTLWTSFSSRDTWTKGSEKMNLIKVTYSHTNPEVPFLRLYLYW